MSLERVLAYDSLSPIRTQLTHMQGQHALEVAYRNYNGHHAAAGWWPGPGDHAASGPAAGADRSRPHRTGGVPAAGPGAVGVWTGGKMRQARARPCSCVGTSEPVEVCHAI